VNYQSQTTSNISNISNALGGGFGGRLVAVEECVSPSIGAANDDRMLNNIDGSPAPSLNAFYCYPNVEG